MHDFEPAAQRMARLVSAVADDQLAAPTPCERYTVGDLLDHIDGLSLAFTWAARKEGRQGGPGPSGDASRLGEDWQDRIAVRLSDLVEAWRDADAWNGMTAAGGLELPGQVAGTVGLTELVLHGWDLARATGQTYDLDNPTLEACRPHVQAIAESGPTPGLFGAAIPVADDASDVDKLVAASGRDPAWTAPAA